MSPTNEHNDGRGFEGMIEASAKKYVERGVMRVKKVEPPVRIIGRRPFTKVIFLDNPFLDFTGVWTERGGRSVFFETKSTSKDRLPIGKGGLTEKQVSALELWQSFGAVSFLLWEFNRAVRFIRVSDIQETLKHRKSLVFGESGEEVLPGVGFIYWDFVLNMRRNFTEVQHG